jgi:hypothetical protein
VVGNFSQRALIQPNRAAIATSTLMSWSIVIEPGSHCFECTGRPG